MFPSHQHHPAGPVRNTQVVSIFLCKRSDRPAPATALPGLHLYDHRLGQVRDQRRRNLHPACVGWEKEQRQRQPQIPRLRCASLGMTIAYLSAGLGGPAFLLRGAGSWFSTLESKNDSRMGHPAVMRWEKKQRQEQPQIPRLRCAALGMTIGFIWVRWALEGWRLLMPGLGRGDYSGV
jgi:hypothetical protein